jgi:hypothetical protein
MGDGTGAFEGGSEEVGVRGPSIAIPQQAKKERPTLLDLFQTEPEDHPLFCFLVIRLSRINPPSEINRLKIASPVTKTLVKLRKYDIAKEVAFRVHIPEGG